MRLVLLHPPLLGPSVWAPVATRLAAAGHEVVVADLRGAVDATSGSDVQDWWRTATRLVRAASSGHVDGVLAHSGAGALAPAVCAALDRVTTVVLVDAVLPAAEGVWRVGPAVREHARLLAVDGRLPPWTSWWGDAELADQVPDRRTRAALVHEAPSLAEAFYDVAVPVPAGWEPPVRAYLRLSPAYEREHQEADARGWRTTHLPGRHLDLLARPDPVTTALLALLPEGGGPPPQGTGCRAS